MSWEAEQERLTRQARLYASSPEAVFEELKRLSRRSQIDLLSSSHEKIEPLLLERNAPIINLGLACYGTNRDVFKALYAHSHLPPCDEADAQYKNALRIGCLSNRTVSQAHFLNEFPTALIGAEETRRLMAQGSDEELTALLCNPSISEELLVALYGRTALFASLDEERWWDLVYTSRKNERLKTEIDYDDSPDTKHYAIHTAIFHLLEIAPIKPQGLRLLYEFLVSLDFQQVATPDSLDNVLSRWAKMDDRDSKGYYTSLPLKDEFRCLVAAMYGKGIVKRHGYANANDIALRCAFYGKANITAKDMKAGYERDKDVYAFAVIWNEHLYRWPELRTLFEEEYGVVEEENRVGDVHRLFEQNFNLVNKERNGILKRSSDQPEDDSGKRLTAIETATESITKSVAGLAKELADTKRLIIIIGIALGLLISLLFKH